MNSLNGYELGFGSGSNPNGSDAGQLVGWLGRARGKQGAGHSDRFGLAARFRPMAKGI
jgi:hypothetical protein